MSQNTYKGKSLRPGGGGRFQQAIDAIMKNGVNPDEAKAIAANQGRAKFGAVKMQKFAAAGRKRSNKGM